MYKAAKYHEWFPGIPNDGSTQPQTETDDVYPHLSHALVDGIEKEFAHDLKSGIFLLNYWLRKIKLQIQTKQWNDYELDEWTKNHKQE